MKRFEYKILMNAKEKDLNEYGVDGWELVGLGGSGETSVIRYVLKRELTQ